MVVALSEDHAWMSSHVVVEVSVSGILHHNDYMWTEIKYNNPKLAGFLNPKPIKVTVY